MAVVFGALVVRIRALVPGVSAPFTSLGWVFLAAIAAAAVMYFPLGYYNLTAVELIAGALVFAWLIVLIRQLAAVDADQAAAGRPAGPQSQPAGTPSRSAGAGTDRTAAGP
jgi:hypothetical protein